MLLNLGLSSEEKHLFYENLSREMLKVNGKCVILRDLNVNKTGTRECMETLVMEREM